MSKFICKCSYIIDLSVYPADQEFMLISEGRVNDAALLIEKGCQDEEIFFDIIDKDSRSAIFCPNCGRLWISTIGDPKKFKSYAPED